MVPVAPYFRDDLRRLFGAPVSCVTLISVRTLLLAKLAIAVKSLPSAAGAAPALEPRPMTSVASKIFLSLSSDLASIWRMRSLVTPKLRPIVSSVCGSLSSRPKRSVRIFF
jgi:hypothetical protein